MLFRLIPLSFFYLDNFSFMALKDDGNIAVISRCIEGDDGFHIVGELVVAPERALNHVHIQLKRAIEACGAATEAAVTLAPAAAAAAVVRPPGVSSGRRAGGETASGPPTPTALRMGICTAASTMTAGISEARVVVMAAAATSTTARIAAGMAAAAADAADGAGSAVDTKCFLLLFFNSFRFSCALSDFDKFLSHRQFFFPLCSWQCAKEGQTINCISSFFSLQNLVGSDILIYTLGSPVGPTFIRSSVSNSYLSKYVDLCNSKSSDAPECRSIHPNVNMFNVFFLLMLYVIVLLSFHTLPIVIKEMQVRSLGLNK